MWRSGVDEKIRKALAAVFGLKPDEINENTSRENVVKWDSMKHLQLIVALEQELGIEFENDELPLMTSFKKIKEIAGRKI
jgi:acyl carrier protein